MDAFCWPAAVRDPPRGALGMDASALVEPRTRPGLAVFSPVLLVEQPSRTLREPANLAVGQSTGSGSAIQGAKPSSTLPREEPGGGSKPTATSVPTFEPIRYIYVARMELSSP